MKLTPKAVFGGLAVYFGMAVGTYMYVRSTKPPPARGCQHLAVKDDDEEKVFDRIADVYDTKIGFDETLMGVKLLRWWLMRQAEGDVLEVSAGTGRNLPYYNFGKLSSLTLTDTSRQMLLNARDKFEALQPHLPAETVVRFSLGDGHHLVDGKRSATGSAAALAPAEGASSSSRSVAAREAPGAATSAAPAADEQTRFGPALRESQTFQPHSFDTVVDTFGLCSHEDPVQVLKEMARVCKPGGKIVLLEHGRASWSFVNRILDNGAAQHKGKWGCWWNRDILDIVQKAGLKVDSLSRWHFGTTYVIVAEPAPPQLQSWRPRSTDTSTDQEHFALFRELGFLRVLETEEGPAVVLIAKYYDWSSTRSMLPSLHKEQLQQCYVLHCDWALRLASSALYPLLAGDLWKKVEFVPRAEFLPPGLQDAVELPKFVTDHEQELSRQPLQDYGVAADFEETPVPHLSGLRGQLGR
ncbi:hypothetical protein N2152v2_004895 [Parachlorella kessleri]